FVFCFVVFIARIPPADKKNSPPIRAKITLPAYAYEETYPSQKKPVNNGEEIIEYFKKNQS
ncbi:hypothetical protein J7S81_19070, partial [Acinetobacter baumannii]|nr:hypothetical protein [Acinetobacter baumannii]